MKKSATLNVKATGVRTRQTINGKRIINKPLNVNLTNSMKRHRFGSDRPKSFL